MSRQQQELHDRERWEFEQRLQWMERDVVRGHVLLKDLKAERCAANRSTQPDPEHEMKIGQMMESKYLKKEDVEPPRLVTITELKQENVGRDDAPDLKWTMKFRECKPMVLNSTNLQLCAMALGSDDTDNWIGKQVVLFNDPAVSYGGKLTGGVRIRQVKRRPAAVAPSQAPAAQTQVWPTQTAPPAEHEMATAEEFDDDIPF